MTPHHLNDLNPDREVPDSEFWVRAGDNLQKTAQELIDIILDADPDEFIDLCCIGAGAVNLAAKAVIIIREKLEGQERIGNITLQPYFSRVMAQGEVRNRLVFRLAWL